MEAKYRYNKSAGALQDAISDAPAPTSSGALSPTSSRGPSANRFGGSAVQSAKPAMHAQSLASLEEDSEVESMTSPGVNLPTARRTLVRHELSTSPEGAPARAAHPQHAGIDPTRHHGSYSLFYYTIEDGQHVLAVRSDGSMQELVGPRRVFSWNRRFRPMIHHVAHPGEFLIVRFRDGKQEHLEGPAHLWFDPRVHLSVSCEETLQIAAREAVVVYSQGEAKVSRRVVEGPTVFMPEPGEWLQTFSWHGSKGGSLGYRKVPNSLIFQKLWLLPDQMYHDVTEVRTADDAVITVRLMIFFELLDIEKMLASTHDPIGDFVNAATSDVVDFIGRLDLASFKQHTTQLNNLGAYHQLTVRAEQCGYRINKVVYRGYLAPPSLQLMLDQAIESRTRLQLERATQQQAQELEDFKLSRQIARGENQRADQSAENAHQISLERQRLDAEIAASAARTSSDRAQSRLDQDQEISVQQLRNREEQSRLDALKVLGVDLTALLTQHRADQIIEVRGQGAKATHVHIPSGD